MYNHSIYGMYRYKNLKFMIKHASMQCAGGRRSDLEAELINPRSAKLLVAAPSYEIASQNFSPAVCTQQTVLPE